MTIRSRVSILLTLVATVSVATGIYLFSALSAAKDDATIIEALGRQRMLSQAMAKSVLNYASAKQYYREVETHVASLNRYITSMRGQYTTSVVSAARKTGMTISMTPEAEQHPSIPFPATFARLVNARANVKGDISAVILSEFPVNPESAMQTPLDRQANEFLKKDKMAVFFKPEEINNAMTLTFYTTDIAVEQECADCHISLENRPYKIGDILGIRRYRIPFAPTMASGQRLINPSLVEYETAKTIFTETLSSMRSGGSYPTDLRRKNFRTVAAIDDRKAQDRMNDVAAILATVEETVGKIISGTAPKDQVLNLGIQANELRTASHALVARYGEIADDNQAHIRWAIAFSIIAILVAIAVVYVFMSRAVIGRIGVLSGVMETLADGDGTSKINYVEDSDEIGDMARAVQVFKDNVFRIERLRKERDEAQKLEAVGQLAGGIAHEINTPSQYIGDNLKFLADAHKDLFSLVDKSLTLTKAARGHDGLSALAEEVEAIRDDIDLDYLLEEIPSATEQALSGIGQVSGIVMAMKEFSHPGAREMSPADINRALENTITISRNEWKYTAEVTTAFDETLPAVPCVAGELNQVFLNLIVNAAHAMADKPGRSGLGRIKVSTKADGDHVIIRIEDDGSGIPEEIRDQIFNPFFTTKEVGKGTGQGLAISRDIVVKKHGGTITFDTETGKGTTFTVRLPIQETKRPEGADT